MIAEDLKHTKVITREQVGEMTITLPETVLIRTKSYYEELHQDMQEYQKNILTDSGRLLGDVISCLDVLKGKGTSELTIKITSKGYEGHYMPVLITKTYTAKKEVMKKR